MSLSPPRHKVAGFDKPPAGSLVDAVEIERLAGAAHVPCFSTSSLRYTVDSRSAASRTSRTWALAPNAAQSDALSTAFFVLSDAEVAQFCSAHPQIGAALVQPDGTLAAQGALRPLLPD